MKSKILFDRLFLFFLLVVSVFLLKSWDIVPGLILPHIDDRRLYLKKNRAPAGASDSANFAGQLGDRFVWICESGADGFLV